MFKKTILLLAVPLVMLSCRAFGDRREGEVVAEAGDRKLYMSELSTLVTPDLSPQDSVRIAESYIDMWVRQQLKVQEAEKVFSSTNSDIEKKVEEYRNSLLTHQLDQLHVDNKLDTTFTENQIIEYYNERKGDFILDRDIVRGRIVSLPSSSRQRGIVRELLAGTGEAFQDLVELSLKNDYDLAVFENWTDLSEFMFGIPVSGAVEVERGRVHEVENNKTIYLYYINDLRREGEPNPLDRVHDGIKRALFNQRRQDIIRSYEDSLLNNARMAGTVGIKTKQR